MRGIIEQCKANKRFAEIVKYGITGLATTLVNIAVYQFLLLYLDYKISNLIAIVASKLFAYVTNKLFVFGSKCRSVKELLTEMLRFVLARGATGLFDYFGLFLPLRFYISAG